MVSAIRVSIVPLSVPALGRSITPSTAKENPKKTPIASGPRTTGLTDSLASWLLWLFRYAAISNKHHRPECPSLRQR